MQGELERYNDIIQTQLSQGIVERADEVVKDGREFCIPHKAVLRENAESTKIRIVDDASARANASAPSLNECLEIGPPLQDQLWNVLKPFLQKNYKKAGWLLLISFWSLILK